MSYVSKHPAEIWVGLIGSNDQVYSGDITLMLQGKMPICITLPDSGWVWTETRALRRPYPAGVEAMSEGYLQFQPSKVFMMRNIREALERQRPPLVEVAFVQPSAA